MPNQATNAQNPNGNGGTLADVLVSLKALDVTKAEAIKLSEIQTGTSQEELINKLGTVSEENLVKAKASLYNIPYLDLQPFPFLPRLCLLFLRKWPKNSIFFRYRSIK